MKIIICALALIFTAAPVLAAGNQPTRYAEGKVTVVKTWMVKSGDSYDAKVEKACETAVRIPVYEDAKDVNPSDLTILKCATSDSSGAKVEVYVLGSIGIADTPKGRGWSINGSYFIGESASAQDIAGNWANFTVFGSKPGAGQLLIPAPSVPKGTDVFKHTMYTISLEFEDKQ